MLLRNQALVWFNIYHRHDAKTYIYITCAGGEHKGLGHAVQFFLVLLWIICGVNGQIGRFHILHKVQPLQPKNQGFLPVALQE